MRLFLGLFADAILHACGKRMCGASLASGASVRVRQVSLLARRRKYGICSRPRVFQLTVTATEHVLLAVGQLLVALACQHAYKPTCLLPSPASMPMSRPSGPMRAKVGHEDTPSARHMVISPSFTT